MKNRRKRNSERFKLILERVQAQLLANIQKREGFLLETMADIRQFNETVYENEVTIRSLHHARALLRSVREALHRLEEGTFGICLRCEQEIRSQRLAALPWAGLCLRCQQAAETRTFAPVATWSVPQAPAACN